jgi:Ser/Thr protein kinase RdoA (MazF antagonist)
MTNTYFPIIHSTLSADALLAYAQQHYDIGKLTACLLLSPGLNDTYLLRGEGQQYILRVYRAAWRTREDILYEMDMLLHLHYKGVPVAYPLSLHAQGSRYRGYSLFDKRYLDRHMTLLKALANEASMT